MSKYINLEDVTKEEWINTNGTLLAESKFKITEDIWSKVPDGKVMVLLKRPSFDVLAVIDTVHEFNDFNQDDVVIKKWYYVDKSMVSSVCPEYFG